MACSFVILRRYCCVRQTFDEQFENPGKVMAGMAEYVLKLKPKKCGFLHEKINYLGHILSQNGIKTYSSKTKAV